MCLVASQPTRSEQISCQFMPKSGVCPMQHLPRYLTQYCPILAPQSAKLGTLDSPSGTSWRSMLNYEAGVPATFCWTASSGNCFTWQPRRLELAQKRRPCHCCQQANHTADIAQLCNHICMAPQVHAMVSSVYDHICTHSLRIGWHTCSHTDIATGRCQSDSLARQ